MISLWFAASVAAQTAPPRPAVQTCPDGSVILAKDECATLLPHAFHLAHVPKVRQDEVRWWCGKDKDPSVAVVRTTQVDTPTEARPMYYRNDVVRLVVRGRDAAPASLEKIRQFFLPIKGSGRVYGMCLNRQDGDVIAVLRMQGYQPGIRDPLTKEVDLATAN